MTPRHRRGGDMDASKSTKASQDRFHKSPFALAGIPPAQTEAVEPSIAQPATSQPGPNAFARKAKALENHQLQSNAFYAKAMAKRQDIPPNAVHPALRPKSDSDVFDPNTPGKRVTTMSPFINAGVEHSSPLKLVPEGSEQWEPTLREELEVKDARKRASFSLGSSPHALADSYSQPLTPYYDPAVIGPMTKSFPRDPALTPTKDAKNMSKKSLLERFRMTSSKPDNTANPSIASSTSLVSTPERPFTSDGVPPKAQALLGTSRSAQLPTIGRSPSKNKGYFSRKSVDSSDSKIPKPSFFRRSIGGDPGASSDRPSPVTSPARHSQSVSGHGNADDVFDNAEMLSPAAKSKLVKSNSLHYFDKIIPPTPPAKNTPPNEKGKQAQNTDIEKDIKISTSFDPLSESPVIPRAREMVQINPHHNLSPTKSGGYGKKDAPQLVKRPSMHSLHASIYPDLHDSMTYEELKSRVDTLGLEGLSKIPDQLLDCPELYYSPSVYSDKDWPSRSPEPENRRHSQALPTIAEYNHAPKVRKPSIAESEAPSTKTITVAFPELANLTASDAARIFTAKTYRLDSETGGVLPNFGEAHTLKGSLDNLTRAPYSSAAESLLACATGSFEQPSAVPSPLRVGFLTEKKYEAPSKQHKQAGHDTGLTSSMPSAAPAKHAPSLRSGGHNLDNVPRLSPSSAATHQRPKSDNSASRPTTNRQVDPTKTPQSSLGAQGWSEREIKHLVGTILAEGTVASNEGVHARIEAACHATKDWCANAIQGGFVFETETMNMIQVQLEAMAAGRPWVNPFLNPTPIEVFDTTVARFNHKINELRAEMVQNMAEMNSRMDARLRLLEGNTDAETAAQDAVHAGSVDKSAATPALVSDSAPLTTPGSANPELTTSSTAGSESSIAAFNETLFRMMLGATERIDQRLEKMEKKMGSDADNGK